MTATTFDPLPSKLGQGRDSEIVRAVLSKCMSFEDVQSQGVLFHGTCEKIEGDLRGGAYDGVFWTARTPSVAQAYIPKSGISSILSTPSPWEIDQALRPSRNGGFVQDWALSRAGVSLEDLDIEWDGWMARAWRIPEGWPTLGDVDQWIRSLGYEPSDSGTYEISVVHDGKGREWPMSADWSMPGQLIIALPGEGFEAVTPEWSEDALGYATHNRVSDFARFAEAGMEGFRMSDRLQSSHLGNVGHEAIGILPAGLANLRWASIPAQRHDGATPETFSDPETPEFIAFMKDLNPGYRSRAEIAVYRERRVEGRLYAVMTDSHRPYDKTVLARMAPDRTRREGFWTSDSPEDVWLMDRKTAEEIVEKLHLNNPRIVRAEKALDIIEAQGRKKEALQSTDVEHPFADADDSDPGQSPEPQGY